MVLSLLFLLPVISAWNRLDEVARDRFWAGHPEDFRHSLYVSACRRARGPSPDRGRVSFFCKSKEETPGQRIRINGIVNKEKRKKQREGKKLNENEISNKIYL